MKWKDITIFFNKDWIWGIIAYVWSMLALFLTLVSKLIYSFDDPKMSQRGQIINSKSIFCVIENQKCGVKWKVIIYITLAAKGCHILVWPCAPMFFKSSSIILWPYATKSRCGQRPQFIESRGIAHLNTVCFLTRFDQSI